MCRFVSFQVPSSHMHFSLHLGFHLTLAKNPSKKVSDPTPAQLVICLSRAGPRPVHQLLHGL
jgi:hypothetical protein